MKRFAPQVKHEAFGQSFALRVFKKITSDVSSTLVTLYESDKLTVLLMVLRSLVLDFVRILAAVLRNLLLGCFLVVLVVLNALVEKAGLVFLVVFFAASTLTLFTPRLPAILGSLSPIELVKRFVFVTV